jgi:hypothetical protein
VVAWPVRAEEPKPPVKATAQEDHKRMMGLLRIKELRRGADGNAKSPRAANTDESKATPYPELPDPLVLKGGEKVTSAEAWWKKRRPEIVEDFDREVYGRVPKETPKVKWEVTSTEKQTVGEVSAVTKRLVGKVDNSSYPLVAVNIQLTLTTPAAAKGPVPVIMEFGFNFGGKGFRPKGGGPTWQEQVLAKGWGCATLTPTSVQPDTGGRVGANGTYQGLNTGIIGLCNKGRPRKPDDWGALRAWAWGASRALDYFETDRGVDAKRVGIEGLSRYGKAALVAMAYDERFAVGFIGSSGAGGAKIHRRDFGEKVENVAGPGEYHWMAGNYLKYAGPLTAKDLPVDSHELVALCAPRPVFISVGSHALDGNGWIDAKGNFLGGVHAGPVYELLGKKGLGTSEFPKQEAALVGGEVAFRQHAGGHTVGPNWPTFLKWAERYLAARRSKPLRGESMAVKSKAACLRDFTTSEHGVSLPRRLLQFNRFVERRKAASPGIGQGRHFRCLGFFPPLGFGLGLATGAAGRRGSPPARRSPAARRRRRAYRPPRVPPRRRERCRPARFASAGRCTTRAARRRGNTPSASAPFLPACSLR